VDAVLDTQFNPWTGPPDGIGMTPFQYVAQVLREAEDFTPRLLAALRKAAG
jgi:hypothetical protein